MMWRVALQMVVVGVCMQMPRCYSSCPLYGMVANCASQNHHWVPALPPNITHLYLEMNYISEINDTALAGFEALLELDLGMQHVRLMIRNNAFHRQRHLVRLVLGYNRHSGLQLEPKVFVGLSSLQELHIDYSQLNGSILEDNYLQPLLSLETLDLFGNEIKRVRPAPFFSKLTKLTELRLEMNRIEMICKEDMIGFQGKHFRLLNLKSTRLTGMLNESFDWEKCGNPFTRMTFDMLDLTDNGFTSDTARLFFRAIQGTKIKHLFSSGPMGKGFSHDNRPDPNKITFEGLKDSAITHLDLSKNWIFSLQKGVFSSLDEVKIIDISENKINQINKNSFDGLQGHLRMLNMSSNLLGEIFSHTFTNLTDLRVLDLSYNHIGKLGDRSFSGLPNLRMLDLTGNSLRELGSPASLPSLDYLLLKDNKFRSLHSIIYLGSNSIHLNIEDNRLTNLEEVYIILTNFRRLQIFYFGGNFKWCTLNKDYSTTHPKHLQVLDLHDSSLQVAWAQGRCLTLFDHLESLVALSLSSNSLQSLPKGIFRGLTSIFEIDLSSNSLTYLEPDTFPESLKRLDLSNNFLASPDPATFHSVTYLSLSTNRFYCDCNLDGFITWLNTTNVTFWSSIDINLPVEELRCEFPPDVHNVPLLVYSQHVKPCEEDDERAVQQLKLSLFIGSTLSVILIVVNVIIYARLRGQIFIIYKRVLGRVLEGPKPMPPAAADVRYDAYLCFSNSDYKWVENALLMRLDNQFVDKNTLHCCFEARDFLPGEDHISNIRDAIFNSRKTICIVSKEFLNDGWCLEAFALAQGRMLEELTNVLIMLVVEKVPHYQLMKHRAVRAFVQKREYLVWPDDPQDLEWFYDRLITQVLKDSKLKKVEFDVAEPAQVAIEPGDDNIHIQRGNEDNIQLENENGIQLQNL